MDQKPVKRVCGFLPALMVLLCLAACGSGREGQDPVSLAAAEPIIQETDSKVSPETEQEETDLTMNIQIGEHLLTATLERNSSTEALAEMLSEGPVTISMNDYAGMEKVGPLPESLPRNDEQIDTEAGDLILYLENSFVIYYDTNSWSLTRLGKIDHLTQQELKEILGDGSVTAVLSLENGQEQ